MTELDFDSDAFLTLLTDALRAGPGSPSWHEAMRRLRAEGIEHADEFRLLAKAREHLESGREYRSIRAGAGFAKRLMDAIDNDSAKGQKAPATTTTVAVGSAMIVLVVLAIIGYLIWIAAENRSGFNDSNTLLVNTLTTIGGEGPLPPDWEKIGQLGVEFKRGGVKVGSTEPVVGSTGGGAYWTQPIDPSEPFSVAANFRWYHADENVIAQLFVTDDPHFDPKNGTTAHEFVWLLQGEQTRILLPGGRLEAQVPLTTAKYGTSTIAAIRITLDHDKAMLEMGGKPIWNGTNGLDAAKPRYIGVRFLCIGVPPPEGGGVFETIRINTRQK